MLGKKSPCHSHLMYSAKKIMTWVILLCSILPANSCSKSKAEIEVTRGLYNNLKRLYEARLKSYNKNLKAIAHRANKISLNYRSNSIKAASRIKFKSTGALGDARAKSPNLALAYPFQFVRSYDIKVKEGEPYEFQDDYLDVESVIDLCLILSAIDDKERYQTMLETYTVDSQLNYFENIRYVGLVRPLSLTWPEVAQPGYYRAQVLVFDLKTTRLLGGFFFTAKDTVKEREQVGSTDLFIEFNHKIEDSFTKQLKRRAGAVIYRRIDDL